MILTSYISYNRDSFKKKVETISAKLGINPDWLMAVMWFEARVKHTAYNKTSGAVGLIQFMPATYLPWGLSAARLLTMSNLEQLDYVWLYFKGYKGTIKSVTDLYLITFFPLALGKPDSYVLETKKLRADIIARQNPIFDINKDHKITVGEIKQILREKIEKELTKEEVLKLFPKAGIGLIVFSIIAGTVGGLFFPR
jgi:hypothetical protein